MIPHKKEDCRMHSCSAALLNILIEHLVCLSTLEESDFCRAIYLDFLHTLQQRRAQTTPHN